MEVEVVESLAPLGAGVPSAAKFASRPSNLSVEEHVLSLIDRCELCSAHIRSSSTLQDIFHQIVLAIAERGYIHSWGLYCMKTRLDALQRLTVEQLCIPQYLTVLGVGATSLSSVPLFSALSLKDTASRDPLIDQVRTLLKDIFLLFVRSENALLQEGSDQNLDTARAQLFLGLIKLKCSPIYPQTVTLKEYGPRALEALTCHILGVSVVSSALRLEVQNATKQLVNALHVEGARGIEADNPALVDVLLGFFQWIRSSLTGLIKDCRREEIIQAVNPSVRGCLKEETYHSPAHMVQVYHTKYKTKLQNLPIPIQPYSMKDIKQAHKDISRENVRVNKVVFSPAGSQALSRQSSFSAFADMGGRIPFPATSNVFKDASLTSSNNVSSDGSSNSSSCSSRRQSSAGDSPFSCLACGGKTPETCSCKNHSSSVAGRGGEGMDGEELLDATEAIASELKKVVVFLCGLSDPSLLQVSPRMVYRKSGNSSEASSSPSSSHAYAPSSTPTTSPTLTATVATIASIVSTSTNSDCSRVHSTSNEANATKKMAEAASASSSKKINWREDFEFFESPRALSRKHTPSSSSSSSSSLEALTTAAPVPAAPAQFPSLAASSISSPQAASTERDEGSEPNAITASAAVAMFGPTAASRALEQDEAIPPVHSLSTPTIYRDLHRMLLAYTLLATSRTFAGGDAFMILNDLYGGEGLVFCPLSSSGNSPVGNGLDSGSAKGSLIPPSPARRARSSSHPGALCDCQVAITTMGIKVKVREHYKLVASAALHQCSNAQQLPPALGYFECTTTTIIILSPPSVAMEKTAVDLGHLSFAQLFEVLISHPQRIVHRAVTIEPYL